MNTYHDSSLDFLRSPHSLMTWTFAHHGTIIHLLSRLGGQVSGPGDLSPVLPDRMPAEGLPCLTEDKGCLSLENENEVQAEEEVVIIFDSLVVPPNKKYGQTLFL